MITPTILANLRTKRFTMAGASPTYGELIAAMGQYEHTCFRDVTGNQYRASIKVAAQNNTVTTAINDADWDNCMARLWLAAN